MQRPLIKNNRVGVTLIELIITIIILSLVITSMAILYKEIITGSVKNKLSFEATMLAKGVSNHVMARNFHAIRPIIWTNFDDEFIGGNVANGPNPFYMTFDPCYEGIPASDCLSANWTVNPLHTSGQTPHTSIKYKVDVYCLIPSADITNINTWDSTTPWTTLDNCDNENYKKITTTVSTPVSGEITLHTIKARE